MGNKEYAGLLFCIITQIIRCIIEKNNVSESIATRQFYNSQVYDLLAKEETKLWHFSPLTLYYMFESERKTGTIDFPEEG